MIRKAVFSDLDTIHKLTKACAKAMITNGIYQWNEHYPTRERLYLDIELQELYVFAEHHQIRGMIVLTPMMDEEYIPIQWITPSGNNLYVHRLAVHPEFWGQGYAQQLMSFAEECGRKRAFNSLRLDTFSQNSRNQKFYETRGYQRLGNIFFPKQSEHPFYCYELAL
ncbi:GNAT family N-acetyltransferase [Aquimarina pacifica]|uniref:GNAT family N-acetyltransferase n=1 Tax=Aquimarina pacifica TaxID=1296415 RepID=UPI0004727AF3|nr:GNAT family N-acetyltransferase [Aquimarina pacifica]